MRAWILAALLALLSSPAAATIYIDATYTGTATGYDEAGFFGTPGATYADTPFIADFYNGPDRSGSFTINGRSIPLYATFDTAVGGYGRVSAGYLSPPPGTGYRFFYSYIAASLLSPLTPGDRTTPYSADGSNVPYLASQYNSANGFGANATTVNGFGFQLTALHVDVRPTAVLPFQYSPIPEPQTWALLMLGLGMSAAALRVRRPNRASYLL